MAEGSDDGEGMPTGRDLSCRSDRWMEEPANGESGRAVGGGRREEVWEEARRVTKMQGHPNLDCIF